MSRVSTVRPKSLLKQIPRRLTHARLQRAIVAGAGKGTHSGGALKFDYSLDYASLDLRKRPELYRVGIGEQGVLLVEPYKSEILPHWKFRTPVIAQKSADEILRLFHRYKKDEDFPGMDMARKFLQMGFTRSRRYANHKSGQKYDSAGNVLPNEEDTVKAASADIFFRAWKLVEADELYANVKILWKLAQG